MPSIDSSELNKLAADLQGSVPRVGAKVSSVIRKSAKNIERGGRQRAPRKTGALANSISTDFYGSGNSTKGMYAVIGPTARYGLFVEYGTVHTPPHPFMAPAVQAEAANFAKGIEDATEGVL